MSWVEATAAELRVILGEENVLIEGDWIRVTVNGEKFVIVEDEALKLMQAGADEAHALMHEGPRR